MVYYFYNEGKYKHLYLGEDLPESNISENEAIEIALENNLLFEVSLFASETEIREQTRLNNLILKKD